jgi:hypothetical protein
VPAPEGGASSLSDLPVRDPRNSEGSLLRCSGRTSFVIHRFGAGVHFENYTDPRKMSAGKAARVVQKLITSYFSAAPNLPSVAELSFDSEIGLYKGGVRVSHISETPASRIGKKRAYFNLGSSTLETQVEHTKWEKCESNLGGAVEPSLTVNSPLESNCESVAIKKRGSGSAW